LAEAQVNRQKPLCHNDFAGFLVGWPQVYPRRSLRDRCRFCSNGKHPRAIFGPISGDGAKLSTDDPDIG